MATGLQKNKPAHFTVWVKLDYYDSPHEDKMLERNPNEAVVGSFWTYSVGEVLDADNRALNKQSALMIDVTCKNGGLKTALRDMTSRLPRFLDENGLRST